MTKYGLILFLISSIYCDIKYISKFLSNLESSENLHSVFILKVGNSLYFDEIIKCISLPKLTIQNEERVNFLNHPQIDVNMNPLKYYFNSETMTVIIAENINLNISKSFPLQDRFRLIETK